MAMATLTLDPFHEGLEALQHASRVLLLASCKIMLVVVDDSRYMPVRCWSHVPQLLYLCIYAGIFFISGFHKKLVGRLSHNIPREVVVWLRNDKWSKHVGCVVPAGSLAARSSAGHSHCFFHSPHWYSVVIVYFHNSMSHRIRGTCRCRSTKTRKTGEVVLLWKRKVHWHILSKIQK